MPQQIPASEATAGVQRLLLQELRGVQLRHEQSSKTASGDGERGGRPAHIRASP